MAWGVILVDFCGGFLFLCCPLLFWVLSLNYIVPVQLLKAKLKLCCLCFSVSLAWEYPVLWDLFF